MEGWHMVPCATFKADYEFTRGAGIALGSECGYRAGLRASNDRGVRQNHATSFRPSSGSGSRFNRTSTIVVVNG